MNLNKCIETQAITNKTCDLKVFLNEVAKGPGLTFIAFTEAMTTMDVTQLWSVLFFMMLLTLGIGTMLGTYEGVRSTIIDLKIIPLRKELVSCKYHCDLFIINQNYPPSNQCSLFDD